LSSSWKIAGSGADGEIADLIDDQQRRTAEEADAFAQTAFAVRPFFQSAP
jgi:hypothetical protein